MTEYYAHMQTCDLEEAARLVCWFRDFREKVKNPPDPHEHDHPPDFMSISDIVQQTKLQILQSAEAVMRDSHDCPVCGRPWKREVP